MLFMTIYVGEHLNFGLTFAAICLGVFGAGSILAAMLGGHLADWIGRKPVMLLALFGGAMGLTLMPEIQTRGALLTAMFTFSLIMEM